MCGRFAFYSAHEAMPALFGLDDPIAVEASYNIAPTENAAVIRLNERDRPFGSMLRWGLIPFWSKDPAIGNRLINARSETAREKPAFRAAYKQRRCLVPADGFYEWRAEATGKQPFYISARTGEPFSLAGLWESWRARDSDNVVETFTILTRTPNDYVGRLHKRMPVVLDPEAGRDWLAGTLAQSGSSDEFPATPDDYLVAWPVERTVNNPRNNGPDLIRAIGAEL